MLHVNPSRRDITIRLTDGRISRWTAQDIEHADTRLAYVQHPFPAQGATTDTTHVIAGQHATQHGTYVALTRSRHRTHIYASHHDLNSDAGTPRSTVIDALTDRLAQAEPETPSLRTPLGHERSIDQLLSDGR